MSLLWSLDAFVIWLYTHVAPNGALNRHQFWWEAEYPPSGAVTANEIHIPVGNPLSVRLDSKDVLHD
jgi:cytochrome c oxidase subunit 2